MSKHISTAGEFVGLDSAGKPIYSKENYWKAEWKCAYDELFELRKENKELQACVDELESENGKLLSQREKFDCSYAGRLRDDPSLIHCPPTRPCQKHRLENLQARADELMEFINEAPHDEQCASEFGYGDEPCDCWKGDVRT